MTTNDAAEHELTGGDELASCLCGDWHTVTFYLAAERRPLLDMIEDMLRHGEHDGPCHNEGEWNDDACTLHVAAGKARDAAARALLDAEAER
jgi:hypothetical protein